MRYISFSFDDARSDTYEIAKPIMDKYGIRGTCNVISGWVLGTEKCSFQSASRSMTPEQVVEWQRWGGEIACHGRSHHNTIDDLTNNIKDFETMGVDTKNIGFASPESVLTVENITENGFMKAKEDGLIRYLRSGIQVRRQGFLYMGISVLEMLTHSRYLYYLLNSRCIVNKDQIPDLILAAAIKDYTQEKQVEYIINRMKQDDVLILMFHSVLGISDSGYGKDNYYWDRDKFERLCSFLSKQEDICVITTDSLFC